MTTKTTVELVHLDPAIIYWPSVRVTSYYDDETKKLLDQSLKATKGPVQPLIVFQVGERYIGVDGQNRWLDALEQRNPTVPCVLRLGTDEDVLLTNLVLNSLHGKTKASEKVQVVAELESMGVSRTQIGKHTGHGIQWVNQLLRVSQCPAVLQYLDAEMITLGAADELAKIEDPARQAKFCHDYLIKHWTVKDLQKAIQQPGGPKPERQRRQRSSGQSVDADAHCTYCHHGGEEAKLIQVYVCGDCGEIISQARLSAGPQDDHLLDDRDTLIEEDQERRNE